MMFPIHKLGSFRSNLFVLASVCVLASCLSDSALGEERKFSLMLAVPSKSITIEGGVPALELPNPDDIWDQYFDTEKNSGEHRVDSFAEYWYEISYGNVSVSGDVFGWVEVPWPVAPDAERITAYDPDIPELPYTDLNNSGTFDRFKGETVPSSQLQLILIDYNGNLPGTAHPDYPGYEDVDIPSTGLQDWNVATDMPVWTPGERFLDVNGNGRYDILMEGSVDGWQDEVCLEPDGLVEDGEFVDTDNDGIWDVKEPFEDFLIIYDPTATHPDQRWRKLDPSWKNQNADDRAWAEAYIRANYPGNIGTLSFDTDGDGLIDQDPTAGELGTGFLGRFGNDRYDGPDAWTETGVIAGGDPALGTKMMQAPGNAAWETHAITPEPDDPVYYGGYWDYPWSDTPGVSGYQEWWEAYWTDRHIRLGVEPPTPPRAPEWEELIPRFQKFDTMNPSEGDITEPPSYYPDNLAITFSPNCGGVFSRQNLDLDEDGINDYYDALRELEDSANCDVSPCDHALILYDTGGDGWGGGNGSSIQLFVDDEFIIPGGDDPNAVETLASGAGPRSIVFEAESGSVIRTVFNVGNAASHPVECAYEIVTQVDPNAPRILGRSEGSTSTMPPSMPGSLEVIGDCNLIPPLDAESNGDGVWDPNAAVGGSNVTVLPDMLDKNNDDVWDRYDGPTEFDDMPSSIYHARSVSGLDPIGTNDRLGGGDGLLGEITSPQNWSYSGQDMGPGMPASPGGPDGLIPAGGPLAYKVHGSSGYDAGNVLNLEYLTWRTEPTAPVGVLASNNSKLYGIDIGLDQLVEITHVDGGDPAVSWTAIGEPMGISGISALAGSSDANTLYAARSVWRTHAYENELYEISTVTGQASLLGVIDGIVHMPIKDMAYDTEGNKLYVLVGASGGLHGFDYSELWEVTPGTLESEFIFELGVVGSTGLAYGGGTAANPILYTIDTAYEWLATIDLSAAPPEEYNLVPVADDDTRPFRFMVLALAYHVDKIYATEFSDHLLTVDVGSGDATEAGSFGFSAVRSRYLARDFNLDGLMDMGEVRDLFTENYIMDAAFNTPNDGGPSSQYPFNRRRLTEDTVAALDASVDWDLVDMVGSGDTHFVHSCILLPSESIPEDMSSAGGRPLFVLPAPSMDLPIQIKETAGSQISPVMFSDFAMPLGTAGETGNDDTSFGKGTNVHEWLHVWEGYPDLYDYDEYSGGIINQPVGAWCIMAGGFVHPSPVLKEGYRGNFLGSERLGTNHLPWLQVTDLTKAMDPLQESQVVLTDYAFDPAKSVYYYDNPNSSPADCDSDPDCVNNPDRYGERFYFYRLTDTVPANPRKVNFSRNAPGEGVLIMHTDFGDNLESIPLQQRIGNHFAYNVIQADGLQQLENGENYGDPNDPFPGGDAIITWNGDTDPSSDWWGRIRSDIEITNIVEEANRSILTFFWHPRRVPELTINRPAGYDVVNGNFEILFEAWDQWGGTTIEFYYERLEQDTEGDSWNDVLDWDGVLVDPNHPTDKVPGWVTDKYPIPLTDLEGDGVYYFYARLIPGIGDDGNMELSNSVPRPSYKNNGRGQVTVSSVNLAASKLEQWILTCVDHGVYGAEQWEVKGTLSGPQTQRAITGYSYTTDGGEATFTISYLPNTPVGDNGVTSNTGGVYKLYDANANFNATDFNVGDVVRILDTGSGANPGFYTITAVPNNKTLRLADDPGVATGVSYRVHAFSNDNYNNNFDRFYFMTTGMTAHSLPVAFLNGQVDPMVVPVIDVSFPDIVENPENRVPLRVAFDGSESLDEEGAPNDNLTFLWDLGNGQFDSRKTFEYFYTAENTETLPTTVTVTLTVTNPDTGINGSATESFNVNPEFVDSDDDGKADPNDNCPYIYNPLQEDDDGDLLGNACDNCPFVANEDQANMDGDPNHPGYDQNNPDLLGDLCDPDRDGDGIYNDGDGSGIEGDFPCVDGETVNCDDNCAWVYNPDQADFDANGVGDVCDDDDDGDGVLDVDDNCPFTYNPGQEDLDGDHIGDVCDPDRDGDLRNNDFDNCPDVYNPGQEDVDLDGMGDACDDDSDNDGIADGVDNCRLTYNPGQEDLDLDGIGDVCDDDIDGDGVLNDFDNCPLIKNAAQANNDGDADGDVCDWDDDNDGIADTEDNCPWIANANQSDVDGTGGGDACDSDADGDGIPNGVDNCPISFNPAQEDIDGDDIGDACDHDSDNDGIVDSRDNCMLDYNPDQADVDGDGVGNICDNCLDTANPNQRDSDGDGLGDECDNCPNVANGMQIDSDRDGYGDACDNDADGDGVRDDVDNCPGLRNADQADSDGDGLGDLCETDVDGDDILDPFDNCPTKYNPGQADVDNDGVGDECDNCTNVANADQADADGDGLGDACDQPADSGQDTPDPNSGQSGQDEPAPAFNFCGFGTLNLLPFMIVGLGGMKWAARRRRHL